MAVLGFPIGRTVLAMASVIVAGATQSGEAWQSSPAHGEVAMFAGDAQHTGVFVPAAVTLNGIRWATTIDLRQTFRNTHYGSPLVTARNTLIFPVKTDTDGFLIKGFNAATGRPRFATLATDYVLPAHNWIPTYGPALATVRAGLQASREQRLYYPGAGGTLFYITNPEWPKHRPVRVAFYGLDAFERDRSGFTSSVFVNTPLTTDGEGNVFFGFRVQGAAPAPLSTVQSGFARIAPDGTGRYVLAGAAAGDVNITRDSHNAAPALSRDERTLYVVVKAGTTNAYAYLLGLDATTLATKFKVFLRDPRNGNAATVSDDSTASPMIAPDGDVYFGVLANPNNGSRGFLLRFSADLTLQRTPGGFGWDSTAAIVPASMVPSYAGTSPYLIFTKYNNYRFSDGDGVNRIAILDPNATQIDPHATANGLVQMREVLTVIGPTPDAGSVSAAFPHAVREWCINTAAVNPATKSIFVPNEDGRLYRWDLASNSLSEAVALTPGFGEPYVPTIIGPDGTVFTLNGGTLFAVGRKNPIGMTIGSSKPDTTTAVAGEALTFTARLFGAGRVSLRARGTVTFTDLYYPDQTTVPVTATLGQAQISGGVATLPSTALGSGTHFIMATHDSSHASVTLVQKVHAFATSTSVTASGSGTVTITATVTSAVGTPTGMVTFQVGPTVLAQVPLGASGTAGFTSSSFTPGTHVITATYASDPLFASSSGTVTIVR